MNKETRITIAIVLIVGMAVIFVIYKRLSPSSSGRAELSFQDQLKVASPFGKAVLLSSATKWDEAVQEAAKALKTDPDNPALYYARGEAYRCLQRLEEAEKDFTKCIELAPDFANAYQWRAYCRFGQPEALADEQKAIELAPTSELCRMYLARTYEHIGRVGKAKEEWKKLADMNPDDPNERNAAAKGLGLPLPRREGMLIH